MNPLDFLKQKLQQGLSTVENWGSGAENDISHAVSNLFGTNATPQNNAPAPPQQFRAAPPSNAPGQLPAALQAQNATPQPNQPAKLPKPIQIQNTQSSNPLPNVAKPNNAAPPLKINATPVTPPKVAPIKIANNQPTPFIQKLTSGALKPTRKSSPPPSQTEQNITNLIKSPITAPLSIFKGAVVDPTREVAAQLTNNPTAYKHASEDAVNDNIFTPFVPIGNLLATTARQKPNEQAAEQSGKNSEQTILNALINKYGDSPTVRRIAHDYGQYSQLSMENQNANDIDQTLAGLNLTPDSGTRQVLQAALLSGISAAGTVSIPDMIEMLRDPNLIGANEAIDQGSLPRGTQTSPPRIEPSQPSLPNSPPLTSRPLESEGSPQPIVLRTTETLSPSPDTPPTELGSHETYENNTTNSPAVNTGDAFPKRNADAERAAIAEMESSGDLARAVKAYSKAAGTDDLTSQAAVVGALQDRGLIPKGEGDVTALMKPLEITEGVPQEVGTAASKLDEAYRERVSAKDAAELTGTARGRIDRFKVLARDLQKSIEANYTPDEQRAIRDNLEGAATPEEVTPKVQAATDLFRQLNEKAYNIRDLARPEEVGRVKQYATRIRSKGRSTGNPIKITDIKDLFNTDSRFSESRTVHKYVATDGEARYGTLKDAGLYRNKDGDLVARGTKGKVFQPRAVSTRELNENGYNYVNKYSHIARAYHSDTGAVKARYDALQYLINNQDKFQIRDTADALPGDIPIANIPELQGKYAPKNIVKELQNTFQSTDRRGPLERAWNTLQNSVVGQIVFNPVFHTKNLAELTGEASGMIPLRPGSSIPSGPLGFAKVTAEAGRLFSDPEYAHDMLLEYLQHDRFPTYGSRSETVLTKAADLAGIPHLSKASSAAMEQIDTSFRLSLYGAFRRAGVEGGDAVKIINQFLGDTRNIGAIARTFGMFWNYFRTQLRAGPGLLLHPIRNAGAAANLAIIYAAWYGLNKAFQDWTGNKHASLGNPGSLGIIKQATDIPNQVQNGNLGPSVANHLSPLAVEGANQLFGKDLFTGQTFTNGQDRVDNLVNTLLPASQYVTKVSDNKSTVGQQVMNLATGITLPHTKGFPAIPNTNNPLSSFVNAPGSAPAQGADATGIDQATQYYTAKSKMMGTIQNNANATNDVTAYLSKNHTDSGATILNNGPTSEKNAKILASDDAARHAVQQFEKSLPNHDPKWDLPDDKLKTYMQYESITPGEKARTVMAQKNPWLTQTFNDEQQWFGKQQANPNTVTPSDYVAYPPISPSQQAMMTQVTDLTKVANRTPQQTQQLSQLEQNPDLQAAYGLLSAYTNKRRAQDGLQPIAPSQQLTPEEEAGLQYESSLPKGTGAKTQWINANPDLWNSIQNKLAQITMQSIASNGAIVYEGGTPSNSYLKDIYSAGKYDIAPVQGADGTTSYQLNPGAAYTLSKSSGGSAKKPLVPLPKRPKKHVAKISRLKVRKVKAIHIRKSAPIRVKKTKVLKTVHIGHGGPLKIANK